MLLERTPAEASKTGYQAYRSRSDIQGIERRGTLIQWDAKAAQTNCWFTLPAPRNCHDDNLDIMCADLMGLENAAEDDATPPTQKALKRAFEILRHTAEAMTPAKLPRGFVTTDDRGGVRLEWWRGRTHCVTVAIDAESRDQTYMFVKVGAQDRGRIEGDAIPEQIANRLLAMSNASA